MACSKVSAPITSATFTPPADPTSPTASGINSGTSVISSTDSGTSAAATVSPLAALSLSPTSQTVTLNSAVVLALGGTLADGSAVSELSTATWTVSDNTVLYLDSSQNPPYLSALKAGTATVTALSGSITATATVTVVDNGQLHSIAISPELHSMTLGNHNVLSAVGFYGNGVQADLTSLATFSMATTPAAVLNLKTPGGPTLSAYGTGTAVVNLSYGGLTFSMPVMVASPALTGLTISPLSSQPNVGSTVAFTAIGTFADGSTHDISPAATWTSSNPSVVAFGGSTLTSSQASVPKPGSALITASYAGEQASLQVSTLALSGIVSLHITAPSRILPLGHTLSLTAQATMLDGSTTDVTAGVTWTSDTNAVATVALNSAGTAAVVTPVAISSHPATITASLVNVTPASVPISVTSASAVTALTLAPANTSATLPLVTTCGSSTAQLTALATDADQVGTNGTDMTHSANVTWSSLSPSLAIPTPSQPGQFTTLLPGNATVAATYTDPVAGDTITATAVLDITTPAQNGIKIVVTPNPAYLGNSLVYSLFGTYPCGVPQVINDAFTLNATGTVPAGVGLTFSVNGGGAQTAATSTPLTSPTPVSVTGTYIANSTTYTTVSTGTINPANLSSLAVSSSQHHASNGSDNTTYEYVTEGSTLQLSLTGTLSDGVQVNYAGLTAAPYHFTPTWTILSGASSGSISATGLVTGVAVGRISAQVVIVDSSGITTRQAFTLSVQRACPSGTTLNHLYCLNLGALNQSCNALCASVGYTTDLSGLLWLQNSTDAQANLCVAAANLFAGTTDGNTNYINLNTSASSGLGCMLSNTTPVRSIYNTPTGTAANAGLQNICACYE